MLAAKLVDVKAGRTAVAMVAWKDDALVVVKVVKLVARKVALMVVMWVVEMVAL